MTTTKLPVGTYFRLDIGGERIIVWHLRDGHTGAWTSDPSKPPLMIAPVFEPEEIGSFADYIVKNDLQETALAIEDWLVAKGHVVDELHKMRMLVAAHERRGEGALVSGEVLAAAFEEASEQAAAGERLYALALTFYQGTPPA
jgi:hypothetical protein